MEGLKTVVTGFYGSWRSDLKMVGEVCLCCEVKMERVDVAVNVTFLAYVVATVSGIKTQVLFLVAHG